MWSKKRKIIEWLHDTERKIPDWRAFDRVVDLHDAPINSDVIVELIEYMLKRMDTYRVVKEFILGTDSPIEVYREVMREIEEFDWDSSCDETMLIKEYDMWIVCLKRVVEE